MQLKNCQLAALVKLERFLYQARLRGAADAFAAVAAAVAHALGRRFTGFELNEQYAAMARQRIAALDIDFNRAPPAPAPAQTVLSD